MACTTYSSGFICSVAYLNHARLIATALDQPNTCKSSMKDWHFTVACCVVLYMARVFLKIKLAMIAKPTADAHAAPESSWHCTFACLASEACKLLMCMMGEILLVCGCS